MKLKELLDKIDRLSDSTDAKEGDLVSITFNCGCVILTVKGNPKFTGFLKYCNKHELELKKIDPSLVNKLKVKFIPVSEGYKRDK